MRDKHKPTLEEIDKMSLGDLVHFMIGEYEKDITEMYGDGPYVQSTEYHHAYLRLNEALDVNKETK